MLSLLCHNCGNDWNALCMQKLFACVFYCGRFCYCGWNMGFFPSPARLRALASLVPSERWWSKAMEGLRQVYRGPRREWCEEGGGELPGWWSKTQRSLVDGRGSLRELLGTELMTAGTNFITFVRLSKIPGADKNSLDLSKMPGEKSRFGLPYIEERECGKIHQLRALSRGLHFALNLQTHRVVNLFPI